MADIKHGLFIKFGLGKEPSDLQEKQWAAEVAALIRRGEAPERAGHVVAERLFTDYNTHVYASEADTIEALLAAAGERVQRGG